MITQSLYKELEILPIKLIRHKLIRGYNGKGQQKITESIHSTLRIGDHIDANTPIHVINLDLYDLILDLPYMRNHGIVVDPIKNRI